jgi:hypothetical protein
MKKFITALAATFATVVIGSAASAATPTFNVYHEEVLPALAEANTPATFSVYHEEVLPALVAANTPPTFNVVREEILPAMNRVVADADPYSEQIVGGIGPQLPYDPMRGVDYGFVQALNKLNADPFAEQIVGGLGPQINIPATFSVYHEEVLPAMNRVVADADPYSEQIVGGIGPQLPYDPMRGVDYGFVQALLQQNVDPFSEVIVGGLGPQSDLDSMMTLMTDWVQPATNVDPFSEEVVGGLGPQINFVASN